MNKITKKSFYSFLTLYLLSSFFFLSLASYWFYTAQVATEMSSNYYKMSHISDRVSSDVISAHMSGGKFVLELFESSHVALYDSDKNLKYGSNIQEIDFTKEYYMEGEIFTLVSQRTKNYLGIEFVVVQSSECSANVAKLTNTILYTSIIVAIIIIFIAVVLSYMFLKPIKEKMQEIENFIKDTTPNTKIYIKTTAKSFSIKDEGIGIAEDKFSSIFERFSRANSYAGGFGVGLNIVDGIVKEYGYKIAIESKEGSGTTVFIEF